MSEEKRIQQEAEAYAASKYHPLATLSRAVAKEVYVDLAAKRPDDRSEIAGKGGLMPCPFCGSNELVATKEYENVCTGLWMVKCISCGVKKGYAEEKEDAIKEWNKRCYQPYEEIIRGLLLDYEKHRKNYRGSENYFIEKYLNKLKP